MREHFGSQAHTVQFSANASKTTSLNRGRGKNRVQFLRKGQQSESIACQRGRASLVGDRFNGGSNGGSRSVTQTKLYEFSELEDARSR